MIASSAGRVTTSSITYALPFEPLARFKPDWDPRDVGGVDAVLDERQQRAFYRAQRAGWISFRHADELACALDLHPGDVWGELYYDNEELV